MSEAESATPPAPAAAKEEGAWAIPLPAHPNEALAKKLANDWQWVQDAAKTYQDEGNTRLRRSVRAVRGAAL